MATPAVKRASERRAEHLLNDLLLSQGWDLRRPPQGELLFQHEYRHYPEIAERMATASKSGEGPGIPEAILVDRETITPLAVSAFANERPNPRETPVTMATRP